MTTHATAAPPRRTLVWIGVTAALLLLIWTAMIAAGVLHGWGHRTLAPRGDAAGFAASVQARIDQDTAGAAAFVLIERGAVVATHTRATRAPVDGDTLFQVASLSKWVTAWGVMTLVRDGRLDLDAPISTYLTRWQLPDGPYDETQVTARRLLSHTAGLTDDLGYGGFMPGQAVQPLAESLTHARDASPGADGRVRVGAPPGHGFRYSGGGYALLQLVIEEVSGEPFEGYMQRAVLRPLGMTRSTFAPPPGARNIAESFTPRGDTEALRAFSAPAAASLYTSAADLTRFLQAQVPGANGAPAGRGVLTPAALTEMRRPHATRFGFEIWGLGTVLYAPTTAGGFIIGHDGANAPAINTAARIDPRRGDGIILLESGAPRLATDLAGEWVFWKTGAIDLFMAPARVREAAPILLAGWGLIVAGALTAAGLTILRRRKPTRIAHPV